MITATVAALPPVTQAQIERIKASARNAASHHALLQATEAMNLVEIGGAASATSLPETFGVVAWNVERGLFPEASAAHLSDLAPSVVLLSEVDCGMARTAQRHTTKDFAAAMRMQYAYGVEFYEMGLGGPTERKFCEDDFNGSGWHGNAILSAVPMTRVAMIRLDEDGHWFTADSGASDPEQPRIGGRMALLAELPTSGGPITFVSTHLESNAGVAHRHVQFEILLKAVNAFAPEGPVLIGGDLNTGNHVQPDHDWRKETLFALAEADGFSWDFTADGTTTRPSLITPHPDRVMKLDWIAGRGFTCTDKGILSSISKDGTPLSDHDAVWSRVSI